MVDLDLRRLRVLRELQERGTLAAVAEATGYSPSAVSLQLAALEKQVRVPLTRPAGRGLRLTPAGQLLAARGGELLDAAQDTLADLAALGGEVRGRLRAAGLQSAVRHVLIPALVQLSGKYEHLRLELLELEVEAALPELRLGNLDLLVADEYAGQPRPRPAGLVVEVLHREAMQVALPAEHRLALRGTRVRLTDLREEVWTASAAGTGHTAMVVAACRSVGGFEPDLRHLTNDVATQLDLVRRTGAVALLPAIALPQDDPTVVVLDVAGEGLGRTLLAMTREGPRSPGLEALLDAVRRQLPGAAR